MLPKPKDGGLVAATVAEGVAFVLGSNYAEREPIRDQVIELGIIMPGINILMGR
jgi:hypothetical protein